jgi:protein-S-isoprenylcysteine O-methyltransferase Ste14
MNTLLDRLELKVPPVAVAAACAVAMLVVSRALPELDVALPMRRPVALVLLALGAWVGLAGVAAFRSQRTTVNPIRPGAATSLVHGGVYRWTRNPMYLALALGLAALALWLANLGSVLLVPVFVAWMNRLQIVPEERALRAKFGPAYAQYASRVRRWF